MKKTVTGDLVSATSNKSQITNHGNSRTIRERLACMIMAAGILLLIWAAFVLTYAACAMMGGI